MQKRETLECRKPKSSTTSKVRVHTEKGFETSEPNSRYSTTKLMLWE